MDDINTIMRSLGKLEGMLEQALSEMKSHADRMNRIDQDIEDTKAYVDSKVNAIEEKYTELTKSMHELDKKNAIIFTLGSLAGFLINLAVNWFKK